MVSAFEALVARLVATEALTVGNVKERFRTVRGLFPFVADGVAVRPLLKGEDLRLIIEGLIVLMVYRGEMGAGSRCVQLMRRVLRKVSQACESGQVVSTLKECSSP